jgi:Arc/MetJ family transcription regulator
MNRASATRITVTVDPDLLRHAQRLTGARTKREAIELALREVTGRRRRARIIEHAGKIDLALSVKDLLRLRAQG